MFGDFFFFRRMSRATLIGAGWHASIQCLNTLMPLLSSLNSAATKRVFQVLLAGVTFTYLDVI